MTNEFILHDRLTKIKSTVEKYGEENFFISYSGGKDSNVLDKLFDMALPNNKIPRVYCDTGIELNAVRDFVRDKAKNDDRFIIIQPKVPIKKMLEEVGYPFKSKAFSYEVSYLQNHKIKATDLPENYWIRIRAEGRDSYGSHNVPKLLRYIYMDPSVVDFKISDKCCKHLKVKPLNQWQKENNKPCKVVGLMREEGGRRDEAKCMILSGEKLKAFQPLVVITKEWEDWFIQQYSIELPIVYYPPYSFRRTGCKGCPFNIKLDQDLNILKQYFPNEYKQCEIIWKPVYDEYRRIGYRLN